MIICEKINLCCDRISDFMTKDECFFKGNSDVK
jgi:hypothetical protein